MPGAFSRQLPASRRPDLYDDLRRPAESITRCSGETATTDSLLSPSDLRATNPLAAGESKCRSTRQDHEHAFSLIASAIHGEQDKTEVFTLGGLKDDHFGQGLLLLHNG